MNVLLDLAGNLRCTICGTLDPLPLPLPCSQVARRIKLFSAAHTKCIAPQFPDCVRGWIDPAGHLHQCGEWGHEGKAEELAARRGIGMPGLCASGALRRAGWIKVHTKPDNFEMSGAGDPMPTRAQDAEIRRLVKVLRLQFDLDEAYQNRARREREQAERQHEDLGF